jgi:hypothetical protein
MIIVKGVKGNNFFAEFAHFLAQTRQGKRLQPKYLPNTQ